MAKQIHWFPGHMSKALSQVEKKIKLVDVVIELLDARAPLSSINENLEELIKNKKTLIVLTKEDLADPKETGRWTTFLKKQYNQILVLNLNKSNSESILAKAVVSLGKEKWDKEIARGMKPQPIRAMIIGVPNVGKSSLINRLAKRKAAGVQNKPGFTRGEQWIRVSKDFLLLDTPGILPMNYENRQKAINLALIGSIREDILPNEILSEALLDYLRINYPTALNSRYEIREIGARHEVLNQIAERRKLVDSTGQNDLLKAETLLLKEFKDGLLGRISLEKYES